MDKRITDIINELGFDPKEVLWQCHSAWIMFHRFIEEAGNVKGVIIESLDEVETKSSEGIAVIKCTATMGDRKAITYGEASPKNCKIAFPYAVAEKRAVDRAILKLIGLHGFVYSEEEADDFKAPNAPVKEDKPIEERHLAQLKKHHEAVTKLLPPMQLPNDEDFFKFLSKKIGRNVTSYNDLKNHSEYEVALRVLQNKKIQITEKKREEEFQEAKRKRQEAERKRKEET
jgi:hypothetical protein